MVAQVRVHVALETTGMRVTWSMTSGLSLSEFSFLICKLGNSSPT